jgi:hypothetical protein
VVSLKLPSLFSCFYKASASDISLDHLIQTPSSASTPRQDKSGCGLI